MGFLGFFLGFFLGIGLFLGFSGVSLKVTQHAETYRFVEFVDRFERTYPQKPTGSNRFTSVYVFCCFLTRTLDSNADMTKVGRKHIKRVVRILELGLQAPGRRRKLPNKSSCTINKASASEIYVLRSTRSTNAS